MESKELMILPSLAGSQLLLSVICLGEDAQSVLRNLILIVDLLSGFVWHKIVTGRDTTEATVFFADHVMRGLFQVGRRPHRIYTNITCPIAEFRFVSDTKDFTVYVHPLDEDLLCMNHVMNTVRSHIFGCTSYTREDLMNNTPMNWLVHKWNVCINKLTGYPPCWLLYGMRSKKWAKRKRFAHIFRCPNSIKHMEDVCDKMAKCCVTLNEQRRLDRGQDISLWRF